MPAWSIVSSPVRFGSPSIQARTIEVEVYVRILSIVVALAIVAGSVARGQFESLKPSPEHDKLKAMEGTWKATVKMMGAPDSKGTMSMKMDQIGRASCRERV